MLPPRFSFPSPLSICISPSPQKIVAACIANWEKRKGELQHAATHRNCNALQHTATHCNTLQHTATHCNALQRTATYCHALQRTATHRTALQHTLEDCCSGAARIEKEKGKIEVHHTLQHTSEDCCSVLRELERRHAELNDTHVNLRHEISKNIENYSLAEVFVCACLIVYVCVCVCVCGVGFSPSMPVSI